MSEDNPSSHAVNFEAVKISMSQNKDGVQLRLAIHPNDCPPTLHTDWVGSRYMVALVRLQDDDTVAVNADAQFRRKAVAMAGTMCRNPKFQTWLVHMGIADQVSEDAAAIGIKEHLMIGSRKELETDDTARKKFMDLVSAFELDERGPL